MGAAAEGAPGAVAADQPARGVSATRRREGRTADADGHGHLGEGKLVLISRVQDAHRTGHLSYVIPKAAQFIPFKCKELVQLSYSQLFNFEV